MAASGVIPDSFAIALAHFSGAGSIDQAVETASLEAEIAQLEAELCTEAGCTLEQLRAYVDRLVKGDG
jgi:hypothetical protein